MDARVEGRLVPPDRANGNRDEGETVRVADPDRYKRHPNTSSLRMVCSNNVRVGESRTFGILAKHSIMHGVPSLFGVAAHLRLTDSRSTPPQSRRNMRARWRNRDGANARDGQLQDMAGTLRSDVRNPQ